VKRPSFLAAIGGVALLAGCAGRSVVTRDNRPTTEAGRRADSAAHAAIERERTIDVSRIDARSIAVAPFAVPAADTALAPLSYALADLLMRDLGRSAQVRVVERLQLAAIVRELGLAESGRVDPATAPRIGRLVGARRIVVGALSNAGTAGGPVRVAVDARLADVSTAVVTPAVRATAPLTAILDAEKQLAFRIFTTLRVTLTPAERALVEQRPTSSLAALLAYGRAVRAEYRGDWSSAAREFNAAFRADPAFDAARVRVGETVITSSARVSTQTALPIDRIVSRTTDRVTVWSTGGPVDRRGSSAGDPVFILGTAIIIVTVVPPR
jgi:TolB-like protein